MKKVLTITIALLLILIHGQGFARSIDLKTARATAMDFLKTKAPSGRLMASPPHELWIHKEQGLDASSQPAFYVVSTDKGFVIVAGDDRARQVLAYSDYPLDNMDDIPDNMRFFLDLYKRQIEVLQAQPDLMPSPPPIRSGDRALESVPPLLASEWGQTSPYNLKCPMVDSTRAVVGCSAVSLAQVMRYWQYPASCDSLPGYTTRTKGLYVDPLPPTTFAWELMLDKYRIGGNHTSEQLGAVTTLMRYVAQAEHMDYRHGSSDASEFDILDAIRFFGFDKNAFFAEKTSLDGTTYYSDPIWEVMLHNELKSHRPVIYCGYSMTSDTTMTGHAFNVDGYNADDGTFHVNFGWRGTGNGYYALNAFTLNNYVFNVGQIMFLGVEPPVPDILVSDDELDLTGYVGESTTDTIYVSGYYLTGEISAVLDSDDDCYSIEVLQDSLGGATIVVTYSPQNVGESEASIVISSEGAQDVTVFIHGNASIHLFTPVMMPADSAAITTTSFRADWTDETQPDVIASYILEVATTPEFLPDSAEYRIFTNIDTTCCNVDTLTPGNTYYYRVKTLYNDSTLSEWSNVESVTLPVLPTPELSVSTEKLILTSYVGETATDTITVTGTNLTGDITALLDSDDDVFSIEVLQDTLGGATIVVTYSPQNAGESEASIIISSEGAQDVTVFVHGNASIHLFTPVMMPADSAAITTTSFRADWTDETQPDVIASYILEVATTPEFLPDSAEYRIFTNIDTTCCNVDTLTPGNTYYYRVRALYNDSTLSEWSNFESVTLPVPPTPELSVSTEKLILTSYVGETATDTITVTGTNLTGEITAVLDSDDDAFSIEVLQDTLGGATIVVTYSPQNAGESEASIVISSEGAQDVTVFIHGNASIHLFTPVMMPADSADINTTSFRADWTDETQPDAVASYILEVATTPEFLPDSAEYRIFTDIDTTCCNVDTLTPGNTYYYRVRALYNDSTLSEWSNVESVTLPVPPTPELSVSTEKLVLTGYVGETATDTITVTGTNLTGDITEILDSDNDAFSIEVSQDSLGQVIIVVTYSPQNVGESQASIIISSEGAQDVTVFVHGNASIHLFTPVMMPADSTAITTTSFRADWTDETQPDVIASYILEVATTPEFLPDSAEYRIFTNIDTTCCNVDTLTPGNTYYYRVRTLYNDSTLSEWSNVESVTLPVPPTPELSVSTEKLVLTGYVGETATDTITVTGTNLTGDITAVLDSDDDAFSIDVLQDTLGGATIVVTYNPQNIGESEASIVISSEGAQDVTVFIHGNASIHLFTPVMMSADSAAITTTSFRADWTDETQPDAVASYILEVATTPEFLPDSAEYRIFTGIDTTCCNVDTLTPGNTYYYRVRALYNDSTLSEWSNVESVTLPVLPTPELSVSTEKLILTGYVGETATDTITVTGTNLTGDITEILDSDNDAFSIEVSQDSLGQVIIVVTYNPQNVGESEASIIISSEGAQDVTVFIHGNASIHLFTPVMMPADSAAITTTSFRADWTDETQPDVIASYILEVATTTEFLPDSADYRIFTGIDTTCCNVDTLTPGNTYYYRVRTLYNDSTLSEWSNVENVTLPVPTEEHGFELGDINHDGLIGIADVTWLVEYLLDIIPEVCPICSDVNQDGIIGIADISTLTDILLEMSHASE